MNKKIFKNSKHYINQQKQIHNNIIDINQYKNDMNYHGKKGINIVVEADDPKFNQWTIFSIQV